MLFYVIRLWDLKFFYFFIIPEWICAKDQIKYVSLIFYVQEPQYQIKSCRTIALCGGGLASPLSLGMPFDVIWINLCAIFYSRHYLYLCPHLLYLYPPPSLTQFSLSSSISKHLVCILGGGLVFFFNIFLNSPSMHLLKPSPRGCPCGVMVKAMDCGIMIREFVLQSRYYIHFRANTLRKGMNPLILPAMG